MCLRNLKTTTSLETIARFSRSYLEVGRMLLSEKKIQAVVPVAERDIANSRFNGEHTVHYVYSSDPVRIDAIIRLRISPPCTSFSLTIITTRDIKSLLYIYC